MFISGSALVACAGATICFVMKRKGTKLTFVLPIDAGPVSVVGDFNGWDPFAHPLKKRSNGTLSISVEVDHGSHSFRYLGADGGFFDEPDADAIEANGYGDTHSLVVV